MDLKGKLWDIITENTWSDRGSRDVCGVEESVQAIVDYLPDFILLEEGVEPKVGDVVRATEGRILEIASNGDDDGSGITYKVKRPWCKDEYDHVYLSDISAIIQRNGLPALIRKGE